MSSTHYTLAQQRPSLWIKETVHWVKALPPSSDLSPFPKTHMMGLAYKLSSNPHNLSYVLAGEHSVDQEDGAAQLPREKARMHGTQGPYSPCPCVPFIIKLQSRVQHFLGFYKQAQETIKTEVVEVFCESTGVPEPCGLESK